MRTAPLKLGSIGGMLVLVFLLIPIGIASGTLTIRNATRTVWYPWGRSL